MAIYLSTDMYYPLMWLCDHHSVNHHLVLSLIQQESAFNPGAIGDYGQSFGLMQLHVQGAGWGYPPEQLLLIPVNLRVGITYLADMIRATGYDKGGLSAYNQGLGSFRRNGPALNADYVQAIVTRYEAWCEESILLDEEQVECFRMS